jgi:hypothetical protein
MPWLTSDRVATVVRNKIAERWPGVTVVAASTELHAEIQTAYELTGYTREFKILRLCEKLKDSIEAGAFGPLYVDPVDGHPVTPADPHVKTQAYDIWKAMYDIYDEALLECFDEEGNYIC